MYCEYVLVYSYGKPCISIFDVHAVHKLTIGECT